MFLKPSWVTINTEVIIFNIRLSTITKFKSSGTLHPCSFTIQFIHELAPRSLWLSAVCSFDKMMHNFYVLLLCCCAFVLVLWYGRMDKNKCSFNGKWRSSKDYNWVREFKGDNYEVSCSVCNKVFDTLIPWCRCKARIAF